MIRQKPRPVAPPLPLPLRWCCRRRGGCRRIWSTCAWIRRQPVGLLPWYARGISASACCCPRRDSPWSPDGRGLRPRPPSPPDAACSICACTPPWACHGILAGARMEKSKSGLRPADIGDAPCATFLLEALPMRHLCCESVLVVQETISGILSGIMLVSTLVTSLDATILLETMLISPHTYELGGDLREGFYEQQTIRTSSF